MWIDAEAMEKIFCLGAISLVKISDLDLMPADDSPLRMLSPGVAVEQIAEVGW